MKRLPSLLCLALLFATLLTACDSKDAPQPDYEKLLTRDRVTMTPAHLQIEKNQITVSIRVDVPARFVPRKGLLTLTPVIRCKDKEFMATARTWQGDRAVGKNEVIPYDRSALVFLQHTFIFEDGMSEEDYEFYLGVHVIDGPVRSFYMLLDTGRFPKKEKEDPEKPEA